MKTRIATRFLQLTFATLLVTAPLAHAHSVWIEDTPDKQLVIRFGEPGEEYEKSPGYLDSLSHPEAWKTGEEGKPAAFTVEKKSDYFLLVGATPAQAAFGETGFPVMTRKDAPGTKPFFHMRWLPAGQVVTGAPALTLDIVPTGEAGVFRVTLRGQPLPDAKVVIHPPGGKEEETKADAQGILRFMATKSGLYLITANHREPVGGYAAGKTYDRTSFNASVSWRQP